MKLTVRSNLFEKNFVPVLLRMSLVAYCNEYEQSLIYIHINGTSMC